MTKLPSISRRPAGLTEKLEEAILKAAEDLTADAVQAFIEKNDEAKDYKKAKAFFKGKNIDQLHVYWCVKRRDFEKDSLEALGITNQKSEKDQLEEAKERLRSLYVYGSFRNQIYDLKAKDWIQTASLDNLESVNMPVNEKGKKYSPFGVLRNDKDALRVHNEKYIPGNNKTIVEQNDVKWLNTWTEPKLKPKKGEYKQITDHILYLCNGNKEQASHFLDWLAYLYQNPGKKMLHAMLLISPHQGVGKDTIVYAMKALMDAENIQEISDEDVAEGRYDFMKRSQLVVVPETMSGDRKDLANKLKPLITQEVVRLNEKFVAQYNIQNTTNFLMFSNHENAAHIEDKDRRYYVIICKQKPKDISYYKDLYDNYIRTDKIAGFAYFLKNRDLSHFNPSASAPDTADKEVVKNATRGGVEAWLDDVWESNEAPFDNPVVTLRDAMQYFQVNHGPKMTLNQIGAFLKRKGGGNLGKKRINGQQPTVWAVRDFEEIENALLMGEIELRKESKNDPVLCVDKRKVRKVDFTAEDFAGKREIGDFKEKLNLG